MMRAGKLRHRLQLHQPTYTQDSTGHSEPTYASKVEVWGDVARIRGNEAYISEQLRASGQYIIKMRYRDDIAADWRIVFKGKTYSLIAPPIDVRTRGRELHCVCNEGIE